MKYQLQPEQAEFNDDGITIKTGWALIYNTDSITGEYKNASYEYLPLGVSLPAHAYLDSPKQVDQQIAIVRQGNEWIYPADFRGQKIYSIETGAESVMTEFGEIPDNATLLAPKTDFDSWDGEKWVLDTVKQHQHDIDEAKSQKNTLISEATAKINYLQDAVESDIATDEEVSLLSEWKKYRVLLNRIDALKAPDIEWPVKP